MQSILQNSIFTAIRSNTLKISVKQKNNNNNNRWLPFDHSKSLFFFFFKHFFFIASVKWISFIQEYGIDFFLFDICVAKKKKDNLSNLHKLNLSSNAIHQISGLGCLTALRELNLSSNQLCKMEGLHSLHELRILVLSYNKIFDLSGLGNDSKKKKQLFRLLIYRAWENYGYKCCVYYTNNYQLHVQNVFFFGNPLENDK